MHTEPIDIKSFSPHLFWDVDPETLSFGKNKEFIVGRVLDYGLMKDWILLRETLGIKGIAEIALNLRELDPVSLNFIATISKIPIDKFRCYTTQQSIPRHWNF